MKNKVTKNKASPKKKNTRSTKVKQIPEFPDLVHDLILEQDATAIVQARLARDAAKDYVKAQQKLEKHGDTSYMCETMSGDRIYREYPEVSQMTDAWQRLLKILKEFKLTLKEAGGKKTSTNPSPIIQLVNER